MVMDANCIPGSVVHGTMGCGQENFKIVWRCHQLLSGFLAPDLLSRMSRQSLLPANDKGDNSMMPRAVHRSPGTYLKAEENPGKPQLGDSLMKGLYDQSSPQMGSLSSK